MKMPLLVLALWVATPTPLRIAHAQPAGCSGNLLQNPGFEGRSHKTESIGTSLSSAVGDGWVPWFVRGNAIAAAACLRLDPEVFVPLISSHLDDDEGNDWTPAEKAQVMRMLSCAFVGSRDTVRRDLSRFIEQTGADEVMASGAIFDHEARLRSYEILGEIARG